MRSTAVLSLETWVWDMGHRTFDPFSKLSCSYFFSMLLSIDAADMSTAVVMLLPTYQHIDTL